MSETENLHAKLARVMGEMSNIPKRGTNTHFNYKFATAEDVAEAVRDRLAKEGIAFYASIVGKQLMTIERIAKGGEIVRSQRWVVDFQFTFASGNEREVCTWTAEADAADDKGINKCATAAEKYFLLKTFIVSTGDEPDADADKPRQQRPQNSRPAPPTVISVEPENLAGAIIEAIPGDATHLPRTKDKLPILGNLNMVDICRIAYAEKLVSGKEHFANLIDLLWRDGEIRAASKPEAVLEAIRKHETAKDLQGEAT